MATKREERWLLEKKEHFDRLQKKAKGKISIPQYHRDLKFDRDYVIDPDKVFWKGWTDFLEIQDTIPWKDFIEICRKNGLKEWTNYTEFSEPIFGGIYDIPTRYGNKCWDEFIGLFPVND